MLPLLATAIMASRGNIYAGLWYPIIVSLMSFLIGSPFIRESRISTSGTIDAWRGAPSPRRRHRKN